MELVLDCINCVKVDVYLCLFGLESKYIRVSNGGFGFVCCFCCFCCFG